MKPPLNLVFGTLPSKTRRSMNNLKLEMKGEEFMDYSKGKQARQQPLIPFVWEERPGVAKRNWKPQVSSPVLPPPTSTPIELAASIPFKWEETPGIPLSCFTQSSTKSPFPISQPPSPPLPSPINRIMSEPFEWEENPETPLSCFSQLSIESPLSQPHSSQSPQPVSQPPSPPLSTRPLPVSQPKRETSQLLLLEKSYEYNSSCDNGEESVEDGTTVTFDFDPESSSFKTDDSSVSSPCLLANCPLSSAEFSTTVPIEDTSSADDLVDVLKSPLTPASETDSNTNNYPSDISSLAGSSFFKHLFPLHSSNSKFVQREECSMEDHLILVPQQASPHFDDALKSPPKPASGIESSTYNTATLQASPDFNDMQESPPTPAFGTDSSSTSSNTTGITSHLIAVPPQTSPNLDDVLESPPTPASGIDNSTCSNTTRITSHPISVPLQAFPHLDDVLESPPKSASGINSSTCSNTTAITSLVGSSFLECLFPLCSVNSKLVQREECLTEDHPTPQELNQKSMNVVRGVTLGELIAMDQRGSCQQKAAELVCAHPILSLFKERNARWRTIQLRKS